MIETAVALLALTALEIVLGIDNIVFISILSGKLPPEQRERARITGLALALVTRILLLLSITWLMGLTKPMLTIPFVDHGLSGKDLILIAGGLFLIYKATHEIHDKLEGSGAGLVGDALGADGTSPKAGKKRFWAIIAQILVIDLVFSVDSVITAVGMAKDIRVMVAAVIISVIFMLVLSGSIARFVDRHPTVKMLALSFLVLIGCNLIGDGFGQHIPKGYTYFAMAFSVGVEMLNLRLRKKPEAPDAGTPAAEAPATPA